MMNDNDLQTLARRAIACKRWRWLPGMLADTGLRIVRHDSDGYLVGYYANHAYISTCTTDVWTDAPDNTVDCLPDFRDPATLGCLLALVREAWQNPYAYVDYSNKWKVAFCCNVGPRAFSSTTEAAAIVAALEAAPFTSV